MRQLLTGLLLTLVAPLLAQSASYEAWANEQLVTVSTPGLTRVVLSPETFDSAAMDLSDLRLVDPHGKETPFVIERSMAPRKESQRIQDPATTQEGRVTRVTIPFRNAEQVHGLGLESPAPHFVKAVTVEAVDRGGITRTLLQREVIYRQNGTERLRLPLGKLGDTVQFLRISLDDSRTSPIPVSGVVLFREENVPLAPVVSTGRIVDRWEGASDTRLVVELAGAKLPLQGLRFEIEDPLFLRGVRLLAREWDGGELRDRILGSGSIHRLNLEGAGQVESLTVDMGIVASTPTREVILAFENGDSPPLNVRSVVVLSEPVQLAFLAPTAGDFRLLSGNAQARAPRYDVASLAAPLRTASASSVVPGRRIARADYRRPTELVDIPFLGGTFDPAGWQFTRPVNIEAGGVQRLELPLHALAHTRADRGDIRLVSEGRQVLYLQEQTGFYRALKVSLNAVPSTKRPQLSRWQIHLEQPRLPLKSVRVEVANTLFDREIRLVQKGRQNRDAEWEEIGRAHWVRTPDRQGSWFEIPLNRVPDSNEIWLETDNGDNAPLEIRQATALVPHIQLLFQATEKGAVSLSYGNPDAQAPRYDLSLVAPRVLSAAKLEAKVLGADPITQLSSTPVPASWFFYGILIVVVVGLGFVISKLIPKPTPE
ncbi:MAG: hypothetical protein JNN07_10250 [Verrucomicrobiales bacterium]|nr:hypothetical protein [Verrucomicrobiales bacterium]